MEDTAGIDPQQAYATFMRKQAEQAGLGARDLGRLFQEAAEKEAESDDIGSRTADNAPKSGVRAMARSRSHIDRLLKGEALPSPPWEFTLQFLRITSHRAGLTAREHQRRCDEAKRLLEAMASARATAQPRGREIAQARLTETSEQSDQVVVALRLEVELERVRHSETRLRYALRDTQFLVTTLWQIIGAVRDILTGNDEVREALVLQLDPDPGTLSRIEHETRQALAHREYALAEADRATQRLRTLERLWDQARSEKNRLGLQNAVEEPVESTSGHTTPEPLLPTDLLAQPTLNDIAEALGKANARNSEQEDTTQQLGDSLTESPDLDRYIDSTNEIDLLVAATGLSWAPSRLSALQALTERFLGADRTVEVAVHLVDDADESVRAAAVVSLAVCGASDLALRDLALALIDDFSDRVREGVAVSLSRGWRGDDTSRDALLTLGANDSTWSVKHAAMLGLAEGWPQDKKTLPLFEKEFEESQTLTALRGLENWVRDPRVRDMLLDLVCSRVDLDYDDGDVHERALTVVVKAWAGDPKTRDALVASTFAQNFGMADALVRGLAAGWPGDVTARDAVTAVAREAHDPSPAFHALAEGWPGDSLARDAIIEVVQTGRRRLSPEACLDGGRCLAGGWAGDEMARVAVEALLHSAVRKGDRERFTEILRLGWPGAR
ncbi:HEAT repeat domain-containing protein [Streptomyces sp. NPDC055287]